MLRIRTIQASILRLHKGTLWGVSSLGLFFAGILIFGEVAASPDEASHALEHLSRSVVIVLLALAVHRLWRPRNPIMGAARALFVLVALVFGVGQLERFIGAFAGDPPHIVARVTSSQVAIIGLGILLATANMVEALRSRTEQRSPDPNI